MGLCDQYHRIIWNKNLIHMEKITTVQVQILGSEHPRRTDFQKKKVWADGAGAKRMANCATLSHAT